MREDLRRGGSGEEKATTATAEVVAEMVMTQETEMTAKITVEDIRDGEKVGMMI